jgi:hypothetical protein
MKPMESNQKKKEKKTLHAPEKKNWEWNAEFRGEITVHLV